MYLQSPIELFRFSYSVKIPLRHHISGDIFLYQMDTTWNSLAFIIWGEGCLVVVLCYICVVLLLCCYVLVLLICYVFEFSRLSQEILTQRILENFIQIKMDIHSINGSLTYSLTHSLSQPTTQSFAHSLSHLNIRSLTHAFCYSIIH